ncbi:MAG: hypothetical protein U9R48_08795 [Chloroflexota bacterium]|nr:hypothetical protein [Chloroflexota bacterium]
MSSEEARALFEPQWLPFIVGGLPYKDPEVAWQVVLDHFPHIPSWPLLPRRHRHENMYVQFSERFPGIAAGGRIRVVADDTLDEGLRRLYLAYLEGELDYGRMGASYAAGLDLLRREEVSFPCTPLALKGEVTGPVSWGLTVVDEAQRPILYDEVLADAVGKHLRLKAAWQERELRKEAPESIMIVNEPYMASFGSAFVSLSQAQVVELLAEVVADLQGMKGVHCCGNTDWSLVLRAPIDIISFDAYDYAENLPLYADEIGEFLDRGGMMAWGIVPAGVASENETAESLVARLHEGIAQLVENGVPEEAILQRGFITPSCGLGFLSPGLVDHILDLTVAVSREMRARYVEGVEDDEKKGEGL